MLNRILFKYLLFLSFLIPVMSVQSQSKSDFKVVLDAGHGGKDFGAIKNGYKEKDIALDVVLKIGRILDNYNDVKVVYSRKTDVFVELRERADKANKAKADLFVSVHCNSSTSAKPYGSLSLVMGLSRSSTNLEIAKTENSVIFQEKNYKENYKGFDPNKPETLIGLKLLQEESLIKSIELASTIQNSFEKKLNRKNKKVHQQPLWVLDATLMPGVLIELGFLSNLNEARYLGSEKGKNELAQSIADAILKFKNNNHSSVKFNSEKEQDDKKEEKDKQEKEAVVSSNNKNCTYYKVQIGTSKKKLDTVPSNFKGLKNVTRIHENGFYKYFYGSVSSKSECEKLLSEAKGKGYSSAFISSFNDNE